MDKNIVLVGFMGTGKSATGQLIAEELNRSFIDMDTLIEERAGKKISAIFADEGEPHFRQLEHNLAVELSRESDLVIACGGGIVLNPANIAAFSQTGLVFCLHADPDEILQRVARQSHRPLLEGDNDKAQAIRDLLAKRQSLYQAIPLSIDTNGHKPIDTAREVLKVYHASAP